MAERYEESWHLDKRLNVGHILTTVIIAGSMVTWAMSIDKRMTRLEVQQEQSQLVSREIKNELRDLNMKMDRLIESMITGHGS